MKLQFPGIAAAIAVIALTASSLRVAAAPNRPKDITVSVDFANRAGDKIQGDGAIYQYGVGGVNAIISSASHGMLIFGTLNANPPRGLQFFFDDCLWEAPDVCSPPFGAGLEPSMIQVLPLAGSPLAAITNGLMGMAVGQELAAFVKINIPLDWDPAYWTLCFDPREGGGICAVSTNSTGARIRRDASNQWTVSATAGSTPASDVADLVTETGSGKRTVVTVEGTYSMPFAFTVRCLNAADCP